MKVRIHFINGESQIFDTLPEHEIDTFEKLQEFRNAIYDPKVFYVKGAIIQVNNILYIERCEDLN
jgi:hypothetical protein